MAIYNYRKISLKPQPTLLCALSEVTVNCRAMP